MNGEVQWLITNRNVLVWNKHEFVRPQTYFSVVRVTDLNGLNKPICKVSDVLKVKLYFLESVMERHLLQKLHRILKNTTGPLHQLLVKHRSTRFVKLLPAIFIFL